MKKIARLYKYEIVKSILEINKDRYMRKDEIAILSGLNYNQVNQIIKAAWKLGWVSRTERAIHGNSFGEGKYPTIKTMYKIKRTESWAGLQPLYKQVVAEENRR